MYILAALCAAYCPNFEELMMIKIKKDWLIIAAVFGIAVGVLVGYVVRSFLG